MKFFEQISYSRSDVSLLNKVRALAGKSWSTTLPEIISLRARMLLLQNNRCIYCQAIIEADENGYREIDHILPKKPSAKCTIANGRSNDPLLRRHTLGYSGFTYEPKNFGVSCKQCNTAKGTYDPRKNRAKSIARYPSAGGFDWVHPVFHCYSKNIELTPEFIFIGISPEGGRVIAVCGLDKAEVLEKKFFSRARVRASQAASLSEALDYLVLSVKTATFGVPQAHAAIERIFNLSKVEAEEIYSRFSAANTTAKRVKALQACRVIETRLASSKLSVLGKAKALRVAANKP